VYRLLHDVERRYDSSLSSKTIGHSIPLRYVEIIRCRCDQEHCRNFLCLNTCSSFSSFDWSFLRSGSCFGRLRSCRVGTSRHTAFSVGIGSGVGYGCRARFLGSSAPG